MIAAGTPAPDFTAATDDGPVTLSALRGKKVVLYFYPKDSTPGCTMEAHSFRDAHEALEAQGVIVLGVSKDTAKKHKSFRAKECLPFRLVSDEAGICESFGVWREKVLYGRKFMGIARVTFLIDEKGVVQRIWDPVKAAGHAQEVLAALA